jgi:hypothetical protein
MDAAAALAVPSGTPDSMPSQCPINTSLPQPTHLEMMATNSPEESETSDDDDGDNVVPQARGSLSHARASLPLSIDELILIYGGTTNTISQR